MFFRYLVCLALLACTSALLAQNDLYDLSQYKARYERRPGLSLDSRASIGGFYDRTRRPNNGFGILSWGNGFLNRLTDTVIATNSIRSTLSLNVDSRNNSSSVQLPATETAYSLEVDLSMSRLFYKPGSNKFWGWSGGLDATQQGNNTPDDFATSRLSFTPSLFRGMGRIEFAEDALLATWIMQDLKAAGVVNTYASENIDLLARTITDIIGNRVFDFRRRRIYELKQLNQTLLESGMVEEESFDLFAILNDNWAFANRATLRHGSQFTYGIQGAAMGQLLRDDELNNIRRVDLSGGAFLEYERHRIVPQNNGSYGFGGRLDILHIFEGTQVIDNDFDIDREWWQAYFSLFYRRVWLPNSRSQLILTNQLLINEWLSSSVGPNPGTSTQFNSSRLRSTLSINYFLNYNWTMTLLANLTANHSQNPNRWTLSHNISLRTTYFIF